MIDKSLSVRSKGLPFFISRHRGFSLIEVMMSVVLIAIGMTLALPSYRDMVEKRQVTNGAEQLATFINAAQGAAMKTNKEVWVSWTQVSESEWCIGANEDSACDCTVDDACQIKDATFVIDNSSAGDRDLLHAINGGGDDNAYGFDPVRGLMLNLNDSLELELRSNSEQFRLNLQVNNTGRVVLCSDSADHAIPGYEVCEQDAEVQLVETGS